MRDGIEHSERRERKREKRWEVHGRSLQHVMNAIRRRGEAAKREGAAERGESSDGGAQARRDALRERTRQRRR